MAENYMVEPKKRRIITDCEKCFSCKKGSSETEPLIQLDYKRCESLISVCKSRGQHDDILPSILNNEDKIKAGEFKIFYHKKCRTNFMLPVYRDTITEKENNGDSIMSEQFTRSKAAEFDWKVNCFICGQNCHPKKRKTWSLVAGAINERSNTYSDVVKTAEIRNDRAMLARMLSSNGDLVAVEARYHRDKGCLRIYINERNVKAANTTPEKSSHVKVCEMLKIELYQAVVHEKRVCELAVLKERFLEIASENKILVNSNIATNSFKKILSSTWPELRFIERKGKTDLVCIDMMSVEEAVLRLVSIETELNKSCEYEKEIETFDEGISYSDETSIVHKAAVILRNRVVNATHPSNKSYFSPEEITPQGQKSYLDPLLLKFVNWLSNKEKSDTGDDIDGDIDQRVVAISSDITALISTSQITPKHLGLSVYLHHTFGSKKLIEDLCVLGYTVSYAEMRHFLTSAALHVSNKELRTQSGAQVPSAVKSKEESGTLMITVADNWDHNEHTCSGKNSTHAMTSILVVPQALESSEPERIPRVKDRSINIATLPGGNCLVEDLDLDPNQVLFGATNGSKGHLHLLSSAATLHFAKANGLTYIGQKIVRGIETDHWQSCMYWDILSSNFTLDYYFSVHNWSESASFRQVPVRAEVQGFNSKGRFNLQSPGQPYSFHHIYEYFDFRTELWEDESVFETPKNMVCPGRKMAKKLPGLPNQFSYSLETIIAMQNYIQYSEVWYDYVNRFIKYDYHPQGENHVTVVHDFSTGLSYEMDRVNGSCKIGAIQNSFDVHNGSVPEMKSPPQMFFVDNSTSAVYYTGKYKIRDIQVDGFISKTHDYKIPGYGDFESTVMLYFMSDSWTTSLNYDTAATTIPIRIDLTTPQAIGLNTTQSMYNFKQGPMPINTFDVSSCFPSTSRKSFMIQYNADNTDVPQQFLEAAVTTILSITNISRIRLQNLEVQKDRDHLYVLGTLLATPQTLGALPNPGPQMSLENAWLRLGKSIAEGVFKTQVVINGKATTFLAKDLIDNGNFAERHPGLHMVG